MKHILITLIVFGSIFFVSYQESLAGLKTTSPDSDVISCFVGTGGDSPCMCLAGFDLNLGVATLFAGQCILDGTMAWSVCDGPGSSAVGSPCHFWTWHFFDWF